ncbi:beta strand repeat-containing protein [Planctomicrobium piriforme]|uniref:Autotransporter-associated beta strand repeat-containing protein n=1 Tax=Planctomicrobium piriforme TaxID=1576369 RepID=A0A1I3RFH2_9PLAN|nr:hypothetical protein [Planctomicrobium piriforme]SFJ44081.1 hypothetical protein SAMN05421753_12090 [Planctomicrobium piriforme]
MVLRRLCSASVRFFQAWQSGAQRRKRRTATRRAFSELLENRTLLAAVIDTGSTLTIQLSAGEQLSVVSQGASYAFASNSHNFTNDGVADAADFSGFGSVNLTLSDLAQYDSIQIVDAAAGASVVFNDSGANAYTDAFTITLNDGAASTAISFNGISAFGDFPLSANVDGGIAFNPGAAVSTNNGGLSFSGNVGVVKPGVATGVNLSGAQLQTTGTGNITLAGTASQGGTITTSRIGVQIVDSQISSLLDAANAGKIQITGKGGGGLVPTTTTLSIDGVRLAGTSTAITSVVGAISITGTAGSVPFNSNVVNVSATGVLVDNISTISSTGSHVGSAPISMTGSGGHSPTSSIGVLLTGSSTDVTSVYGNIAVTGTGGATTSGSLGVVLAAGSTVASLGIDANASDIVITGKGGTGSLDATGVRIDTQSIVSAIAGDITVTGNGGSATGNAGGIDITGQSQVLITSGALLLDGAAGTGGGVGLRLAQVGGAQIISAGNSSMELRGKAMGAFPDLQFKSGTVIGGAAALGQLALTTRSIEMTGGANGDPVLRSTGRLIVRPRVADATIGLGDGATGEINLSTTELGYFYDGFVSISIGRTYDGTGAIDIKNAPFKDDVFIAGGPINLDGLNVGTNIATVTARVGSITSTTGNPSGPSDVTGPLLISNGDIAPGGTGTGKMVLNAGMFIQSSSSLTVDLKGTAVGTGYDQIAIINPASAVTINGATLYINNDSANPPLVGQRYRIIDLVDPQSFCNTPFAGWPEGGSQTVNGVTYKITYKGGTGNDVVLLVTAVSNATVTNLGPTLVAPIKYEPTVITSTATVVGTGNFANSKLEVWIQNGVYSDWLAGGRVGWGTFYIDGVAKGTITDAEGTEILTAQFNANATREDVEYVIRSITYANSDDSASLTPRQIAFRITTGDFVAGPVTIKQVQVSDTPTLELTAELTSSYTVGFPPSTVSFYTKLRDGGGNYANSKITAQLANAQPTELLSIVASGYVSLNGNQILWHGVVVGTFTGGQGTDPLVVSFNESGSLDAVIETMARISYSDSQQSPAAGLRSVTFKFTDGHGLNSNIVAPKIMVRSNLGLDIAGATANYASGGSPALVTPESTVVGNAEYFANSLLSFNVSNAGSNDRLTIISGGDVTVSGNEISYQGTLVATMSGGVFRDRLNVQFNGSASAAAVQAVLRQGAFFNVTNNPNTTYDRHLFVYLYDSANNVNQGLRKNIHLT